MLHEEIEALVNEAAEELTRIEYQNRIDVGTFMNRQLILRLAYQFNNDTKDTYKTQKDNKTSHDKVVGAYNNAKDGSVKVGAAGAAVGMAYEGYKIYNTVEKVSKLAALKDLGSGLLGGFGIGGALGFVGFGVSTYVDYYRKGFQGNHTDINNTEKTSMKCFLKTIIKQDVENSLVDLREKQFLEEFKVQIKCSITLKKFTDPVQANDGYTYDRSFLQEWYNMGHRTCPQNPGAKLKDPIKLPRNHNMHSIVNQYKDMKADYKRRVEARANLMNEQHTNFVQQVVNGRNNDQQNQMAM